MWRSQESWHTLKKPRQHRRGPLLRKQTLREACKPLTWVLGGNKNVHLKIIHEGEVRGFALFCL